MATSFDKKDISTTVWFSLEKIILMIVSVFIMPKIFNTLGTVDIGKLKLAESILGMFSPLFFLGLSAVCVREMVFKPRDSQRIMATAFVMRFIAWAFVAVGVIGYFYLENNETLLSIYAILVFGYLFRLTDVFEYYLLANKRAKFIFIGKMLSLACVVSLQYYGIKQQLSVSYFAFTIVLDFLLQGVFYFLVLWSKREIRFRHLKFSRKLGVNLLIMALPLIVSEALIMVYIGIDEIFLRYFHDDHANGVFASVQFLVIGLCWTIGFAIVNALYPSLAESFNTDKTYYYNKNRHLLYLLVLLGFAIAMFYTAFGDFVLDHYFSEQYNEGKTALRIFSWAPLFVFIGMLYEKHLLTTNRLKHNIYRFALGCVSNVILCSLLIPGYGVTGAAIAVLLSHFITNIGYVSFDKDTRKDLKLLFRLSK
ncbi:flippase [Robertkochia sediminum]|uniref:flippase n=1 Tax=Robertkochia sediminum TaxID=2785326 RepID=UPI001932BFB4|nr:flippase [Robertkochia sediminum]MBL7472046.1 flippase [Robertkochia sediminum]